VPGVNRTLQYEGFTNMYMKERVRKVKVVKEKEKKENKIVDNRVKYKRPIEKTNFPVYITNKDGKEVVVFYAENNHKRDRFLKTNKYQKALKYGWVFID
jgi:hypothetical protein